MQKVIDLETQLQYFEEYKNKLKDMVGKKKMEYIIKNAAYVISCGTNDLVYTYGPLDLRLVPDDAVSAYLHFMLERSKWFLQIYMMLSYWELNGRNLQRIYFLCAQRIYVVQDCQDIKQTTNTRRKLYMIETPKFP